MLCCFDGWMNSCTIPMLDMNQNEGEKNDTLTPVGTSRHILWLGLSLRRRPSWGTAAATSIYGDKCTSTVKLARHGGPQASALALAPQYSATQPDQKQHRLFHSSHSREPLCPFHSSAHGPQRSDKTTCWRVAPNSMCHGLECFSFCACHYSGWLVATLDRLFDRTEMLRLCWRIENKKMKIVEIHQQRIGTVSANRMLSRCTTTHHPSTWNHRHASCFAFFLQHALSLLPSLFALGIHWALC